MDLRSWRQLLICFLGLINFNSILFIEAQNIVHGCGNNGNYTANSTFERNLDSVFSSIPSNIGNSGFQNASAGVGPDRVNVIAICRADLQLEACRSCIGYATVEIRGFCPMNREAIVWRDFCTLRYSNESFFGIQSRSPVRYLPYETVTSIREFNHELRLLLDDIRGQAAAGGPLFKAAAGSRRGPDFWTAYALVQCTPDISAADWDGCLQSAAQQIPGCCNGARGARVLFPSCTLRYETDAFVNLSRIQEIQALLVPPPPPSPSPQPPSPSPPSPPTGGSRTIIIVIAVVVTVVCVVLVVCVFVFLRRKRMKKQYEETTTRDDEISTVESVQHDFDEIKAATNDFSETNELGHGGFGAVYKGKLANGQEVAVKRLASGSAQGDLEFKNEVLLLKKLQHRNLVRLLGFTARGTERLLIYEFVKNGSLDNFIFDPIKRSEIDWSRRYKIIGGIARGLLYLHEDSRFRIIHRDLKPGNILLDADMNPKIADFGLARLFVLDETQGRTRRVVGTYGYMAPEYAFHGQFSVKLDVYSFGVLVLEIVSGQKHSSFIHGDRTADMLSFAWRSWREGTAENMIDPILKDGSGSLQDMLRCIHIGLLCVQDSPADRPTMASVVLRLNSSSITMPIPSRPAFFTPIASDSSSIGYSKSTETEAEQPLRNSASINEVTVSDMYPR